MHALIILIQVGGPHLVEVRCRELPGDDADLSGIAELCEELLARLSRKSYCGAMVECPALARCRRKNYPGARLSAVGLHSLPRCRRMRVCRRRRFSPQRREWSKDRLDRIRRPSKPIQSRPPGCPATIHGADGRKAFERRLDGDRSQREDTTVPCCCRGVSIFQRFTHVVEFVSIFRC